MLNVTSGSTSCIKSYIIIVHDHYGVQISSRCSFIFQPWGLIPQKYNKYDVDSVPQESAMSKGERYE